MANGSAVLWGRFGGRLKNDYLSTSDRTLFIISFYPDAKLDSRGLNADGTMSIMHLLSRTWAVPEIAETYFGKIDGGFSQTFRNSRFYVLARLLYEMNYKRQFIRFGWMPATNASLDSFNINTEFIGQFLKLTNPGYILFEAPPHNTFDSLLYYMARSAGINCFVGRDNGYLGGFRLYLNPLDNWPNDTFQEIVKPPIYLMHQTNNHDSLIKDLRENNGILTEQLRENFFSPRFKKLGRKFIHTLFQSQFFQSLNSPNKIDESDSPQTPSESVWNALADIFENRKSFNYEFFPQTYRARNAIRYLNKFTPFTRQVIESQSLDLTAKYIYFSFAFQPEQTTSILGLMYEDHYLFLLELMRVIPDDVSIYIRDYPLHDWPNAYPRNIGKWKSVLKSDRIKFAPQRISVDELSVSSMARALVNGTAGYESLLKLKPVIYGGIPDYANLPGATHVSKLTPLGVDSFSSWLKSATEQLLDFRQSPSTILKDILQNSFTGWISYTETLSEVDLESNQYAIKEFISWLDSQVT